MKTLVLTENPKATLEICSGARAFSDSVGLVSVGGGNLAGNVADQVFMIELPDGAMYEDAFESILALIEQEGPKALLFEPTRRLKLVCGKLAARLETSAMTDIQSLADGAATSMYFGGAALRRLRATGAVSLFTVAAGCFEAGAEQGANSVVNVAFIPPASGFKLQSAEPLPPRQGDLTAAKRVIAVGRGIAAESDLEQVRALAGAMGAEIGCTRPITENEGWLPRELYIGISGVSCKPDFYLGIGVSGQMQHTVGVNRAKVFAALNKDKNAPILKQADYGLVADLYAVLPRITGALAGR
jgi:electron transfer flavoprotein alpha subunit